MNRVVSDSSREWCRVPLAEVCDVIQGQSPPGASYNIDGVGVPFFQGKAEFGDYYPTAAKWCTEPKKLTEPGDVLISIRAPVGPTNLSSMKACIGRGLAALRPKTGVPSKYLLYALRASVDELVAKATGSTFEAVSGKDLRAHEISLAPVEQRGQIVAEIEKQFTRLEAGVAGLRRVQAKLKRYRAAVLKAACEGKLVPTEAELARQQGRTYETGVQLLERILTERREKWNGKGKYKEPVKPDTATLPPLPEGWEWSTVDELASIGSGNTPERITDLISSKGEVGWFKVGDMNHPENLRIMRVTDNYLSRASVEKLGLRLFPAGTIVFPKRGGAIATNKKRILETDATTDLNVMGLTPNSAIQRYFWWWFSSLNLATFSDGSNVPQINNKDIVPIPVPLPPIAEQQRIAAEVERRLSVVEELETVMNANFQRATRLRQSILQRAFGDQS